MFDKIGSLLDEDLKEMSDLKTLDDLRVKYLGKKGLITELNSEIRNVPNEEKKGFGMKVNELRNRFTEFYDQEKSRLEQEALNKRLEQEAIDISLPATKVPVGAPHILEKVIEEVEEVFLSMGYDVVDGPEIEEDKYNFEMLKRCSRYILY